MAARNQVQPNWWAERWQHYLLDEVQGFLPAESKLRAARKAVVTLAVDKGKVTAEVASGGYGKTYTVTLKVKPLGEREWRRVIEAIAADGSAAQRMLAGTPGPELEPLFAAADSALFPEPSPQGALRCTCRDYWGGCRHVNVLAVHGGQMFAANPFLWLEVLGRPRTDLLAAVRARIADHTEAAEVPGSPGSAESFWETEADPDAIAVRPGSAQSPDGLLRLLGPLPLPDEASKVHLMVEQEYERHGHIYSSYEREEYRAEVLLRAYAMRIGRSAADLARGELAPDYQDEPLLGKPVPLKGRLAAEVEEAVVKEGAVMSLDRLRQACPTAAALPWSVSERALRESLALLPSDLISLLGGYVGPRSALLDGVSFRHVVSFSEWLTGRLSPDADWVRALSLANPEPFGLPDGLLAELGARVGDEIHLRVESPAPLKLSATLHRRPESGEITALPESNRSSAQAIIEHIQRIRSLGRLHEKEAVAVLLAEGAYRDHPAMDPVWLLAAQGAGLYSDGHNRVVTTERWYARAPEFGRHPYGYWHGRENAIASFSGYLIRRGAGRPEIEAAISCVRLWCEYFVGAQDHPGQVPPVAALLNFLWVMAPQEVPRRRLFAQQMPEHLGAWFTWLSGGKPTLAEAYRPHLAACGLRDEYALRVATLPKVRSGEGATLPWRMEGYRWIGADLYHTAR